MEYNSGGALVGRNLYGKGIDEILHRAYGNKSYYFQQDRNGNVTHLTDMSGAIVEKYKYDAFGKPTIYAPNGIERSTTAYNNRFLFTGREYAATFGFYEYRARAYNPTLGRFMSEDPKGFDAGDYNLFRYCRNDPLDLTDPMGLEGGVQPQSGDHPLPGPVVRLVLPIGSNIPVRAVLLPNAQLVDYRAAGGLTMAQSLQAMGLHPVNFNISAGRDPQQNWNRDIHATVFSGGNDPTDSTNPAFLNRRLGANELGAALPGGEDLRGRSIDVVYPRTGARQNAIPVVDKGPFFDGTLRRPADRYWNSGIRPLAESTRANRSGLDLSPQVWRNFGFGIRYDRYGVPYPTSRYDADPVFDWRFH
jgi:RHS repeat-associated protein